MKWTTDEITFLIDNAGKLSVNEIAEILNRTSKTIRDRASQLKISLAYSKPQWTDKEEEFLRSNIGKTFTRDIANKLGRTRSATLQKISKLNLNSGRYKTYSIDYSFFKKISPQLAHFIGFWWADGNIHKDALKITAHIRDEIFLKKLAEQFTNRLLQRFNSEPDRVILKIYDRQFVNMLRTKFLFTPNKSLTLDFPGYINEDMEKYFVTGYFEGDGSVNKKYKRVLFTCGSEKFVIALRDLLLKYDFLFNIFKDPRSHSHYLQANIQDSHKFLRWIYEKPQTIVMDRKYNLFKDLDG